ncbi:DegT/DnrJ/EryC1/StrS family aminotransferase [Spirochaeta dissipatitropha]
MIPITKPYLPSRRKYTRYVKQIFKSGHLTNNGPLLQELEQRLAAYLGVRNVILVANGSLALQIAYKALDLSGEVITTPFSFVATASTQVWEGLTPIFADINSQSLNMNPDNIEPLITEKTSAIVPVHVYGNPCEVEKIQEIASRNKLKVIYDAAHAFGVKYKGESVLNWGDVSTLSFHATKLFHTIEGGAVITNNDEVARKARLLSSFGITGPESFELAGTNAKMNEFEAAMGLCVLDDIEKIIRSRRRVWEIYENELSDQVQFQLWNTEATRNFSYIPVIFSNEKNCLETQASLNRVNIVPRRYFFPSLDQISYMNENMRGCCPVSKDIAAKVLCLPINSRSKRKEVLKVIRYMYE